MTPWVQRLLIANVAIFFLSLISPVVIAVGELIPAYVLFRPWTLVTYMFLHDPTGFGHIFFNMLALYFFGQRVEERLGGRQFLWLYFISGLMAAALSFLTPRAAVIGASGAVYGVMLAFAWFWPRDKIYIWGVLPIEARWLVILTTLISLYSGFSGRGGGVAHFAHLGGFLGGLLYLVWLRTRSPGKRFKQRAVAAAAPPPSRADTQRWKDIDRTSVHAVNRGELDRILDKINAQGIASLTPAERSFLDHFSTKQ